MKVGATWVARALMPRLRDVDPKVLRALKAELELFNARSKEWKQTKVGISEDAGA